MRKVILGIILFLMLLGSVSAAVIHGIIYDISLNKVSGAIVEVNSSPMQRMVSVDGSYSFNLQNGDYRITAVYKEKSTIQKSEEKISISGDGDFVLDLFLFTDISSEQELLNSTDISIPSPYAPNYTPYLIAIIALLLLLAAFILYRLFYKEKNMEKKISQKEDGDLNKILLILKKHGGRATQKDIRKEIPLSEAKISLMIAELEHEKKIKKIKKGRGNIIVLQ